MTMKQIEAARARIARGDHFSAQEMALALDTIESASRLNSESFKDNSAVWACVNAFALDLERVIPGSVEELAKFVKSRTGGRD